MHQIFTGVHFETTIIQLIIEKKHVDLREIGEKQANNSFCWAGYFCFHLYYIGTVKIPDKMRIIMPKRVPHSDSGMFNGIETARKYLQMQKGFGTRYLEEFLLKFKQLNKTGKYLEAGPGPGYVTSLIEQRFKPVSITGLECSTDMISVAEEFLKGTKTETRIDFVAGTVEDTKIIESLGKFDMIYTTYSMHHWNDVQKGIKNLYDALDKNGILFIFDYFRNGFFYYFKMKRRVRESIRAAFRPAEIEQMLLNLGITNYEISKQGVYLFIIIRKG